VQNRLVAIGAAERIDILVVLYACIHRHSSWRKRRKEKEEKWSGREETEQKKKKKKNKKKVGSRGKKRK